MQSRTRNGLLVGAGFLLGTVGLKALTSQQAKQCYVKGIAYGLRAKESYENIVEEAKAQVDDIVAEATYMAAAQSEKAGFAAGEEKAESDAAVAVESEKTE